MPPKAQRATRKQSLKMDAQKNQGEEKGEVSRGEIGNNEPSTKSEKPNRSKEAETEKGQEDADIRE